MSKCYYYHAKIVNQHININNFNNPLVIFSNTHRNWVTSLKTSNLSFSLTQTILGTQKEK